MGFGRYELRGELGRGGMGEVKLAWDPVLQREVAVKWLRADRREGWAERFREEARVVAGLAHPGIVPIFDLGEDSDGRPFLVMRRVAGRTLRELGEATLERRLDVFERICDAVGFAHRQGVIHRDLKPANVMVGDDGEVLVLDWGVARRVRTRGEAGPGETLPGSIVGTPGYLAPEVAEGDVEAHGPASDVFSLGCLLYELITGGPAVVGHDLLLATLELAVVPVRARRPEVDPALARICERCLATYPADRYPDARALGDAIRGWRLGETRRALADERAAEGRGILEAWREASAQLLERRDRAEAALRALPAGVALDDPHKQALHAERRAVAEAEVELAMRFAQVEAAGQAALTAWADSPAGKGLLADGCLDRLLAAEQAGQASEVAYWRARMDAVDDGSRAARLAEPARIELDTSPSGARVVARGWDRSKVVWTLTDGQELGTTPLRDARLPAGSWVLEIVHPDRAPTRLPVQVARGERLVFPRRLPLLTAEQLEGDRWVYVPEGPTIRGGDPDVSFPRPKETVWAGGFLVARHATTAEEYAAFLLHLKETGQDWRARAPRTFTGSESTPWAVWPGEPPFTFPLTDTMGDVWPGDWPVMAIDYDDANAYAAWRGARIVHDDEYEQAARGADGRRFVWGDLWDGAACKCAETRPGRPLPEPIGAVPTDVSPYGVRDLAGSMRAWCGGRAANGDRLRPVRGGQWNGFERITRACNRFTLEPTALQSFLGIRLARDLED